ncbi:MAG: AAA family ATPase [Ilumatobacteraceae bacterium]
MTDDSPFEPGTLAAQVAEQERAFAAEVREAAHRHRVGRAAKRRVDEEEALRAMSLPHDSGNLRDALAADTPPPPFTVAELHPSGSNTLLTAQFKAGKTTLINNVAKSLADGSPFLDRFGISMAEDTGIGVWNYEVSQWQYEHWVRNLGIVAPERIWPYHLRGHHLPLDTRFGQDEAVRWLEERMVAFWIIDPFARAFRGEENSNSEVGRFLDALDVIKHRAGVTDLVIVSHTGRGEAEDGRERSRGATRLDDWTDVRWIYTRQGNARFLSADGRDVSVPDFGVTFDPTTRRLTATEGSRKEHAQRDQWRRIVAAVGDTPGINKTDLRNAIGGRGDRQAPAIDAAKRKGLIRVEENGQTHRHFLTDAGERLWRTGLVGDDA